MVNEMNHPKSTSSTNSQLNQRLAASTRALQETQLEHEQLLVEMEVLRQRVDELRRLRSMQEQQQQQQEEYEERQEEQQLQQQQQQQHQQQQQQQQLVLHVQQSECHNEEQVTTTTKRSNLENQSFRLQQTVEEEIVKEETVENDVKNVTENSEENTTEATDIQEKLNELARLKGQYKKVESLINTTKKIEEHLTRTSTSNQSTIERNSNGNQVESNLNTNCSSVTTTTHENRQLLNAMVDMFHDLSSDLRDQVSTLQHERERIRNLKEDLLTKRQQSK